MNAVSFDTHNTFHDEARKGWLYRRYEKAICSPKLLTWRIFVSYARKRWDLANEFWRLHSSDIYGDVRNSQIESRRNAIYVLPGFQGFRLRGYSYGILYKVMGAWGCYTLQRKIKAENISKAMNKFKEQGFRRGLRALRTNANIIIEHRQKLLKASKYFIGIVTKTVFLLWREETRRQRVEYALIIKQFIRTKHLIKALRGWSLVVLLENMLVRVGTTTMDWRMDKHWKRNAQIRLLRHLRDRVIAKKAMNALQPPRVAGKLALANSFVFSVSSRWRGRILDHIVADEFFMMNIFVKW